MNKTYTSKCGSIVISVRQMGARKIAWALHVAGSYKGSKVLPANNTAIVQNFDYLAADFDTAK